VRDVVPQADDGFLTAIVLEAEYSDTGWAAKEIASGGWRQTEPAGRDHPGDVGAGEGQDVTLDGTYTGDEPGGASGKIKWRFALGAAVAEHFPAGPFLQDLPGQLPLQTAVIPLQQVGIHLRDFPEAGQRARSRSSLQRAGEHASKGKPLQPRAELESVF